MIATPTTTKRHLFVCINERTADRQSCGPDGGQAILQALRAHVNERGLFHQYNISKVTCLGHCLRGPALAIYPDGIILTRITPQDIPAIIERYLG
ncbi:MAG: (2Fe-2S) ferredoxin domain-containing protein [Candidatus Aenigmarchaeota archaeon]|nr:(2Fe-2S) ferredoxin domain-containing protein [Candidatus Aenigmarchaeota archaeon]